MSSEKYQITAYSEAGPKDGPVVLAIPGMGDLRSEYRFLEPLFVDAGFRFVVLDVRGFGESAVEWDDYSAKAVGSDAIALIKSLGASSAIILGNSFAAGSALWAAHLEPELVTKVVLLGPIVHDLPVSAAIKLVLKIGFAGPWNVWFWTTYWDSLFPKRKPDDHAQIKASIKANLNERGRMDVLKTMVNLSKADTEKILAECKVPAFVVMGSKDPDFADAAKEARWLCSTLPNAAEPLIVDGVGHYPHVEEPQVVGPAIVAFCSGTV